MTDGRSARPIWLGADGRNWDHCRVHVQLLRDARLGAFDLAVYLGLAMHAETQTGKCFPAAATLAKYINSSEKTVRRSIAVLRDAGYLRLETHPGKASVYHLLAPPTLDSATDLAEREFDSDPGCSDQGGGLSDRGTPDAATDEREPVTRTKNERFENQDPGCGKCENQWVEQPDGSVRECECKWEKPELRRVK